MNWHPLIEEVTPSFVPVKHCGYSMRAYQTYKALYEPPLPESIKLESAVAHLHSGDKLNLPEGEYKTTGSQFEGWAQVIGDVGDFVYTCFVRWDPEINRYRRSGEAIHKKEKDKNDESNTTIHEGNSTGTPSRDNSTVALEEEQQRCDGEDTGAQGRNSESEVSAQ